eukprot:CAMPEP_0203851274 /NCGR_PEP_ID=MMETSP0359-20131031/7259_1 /ASSEMBLY_ACC=CAM_ASM_000338 /TAXON_ID=268821 /ORGANISM="Scrippsiella Hangoei, Strain SHTV-5" /LENGTH=194 /DNA_ID=CAMNT_0050767279 /DNA_START=27 /DNA_END=608 /DNA_ORIENTATION=+
MGRTFQAILTAFGDCGYDVTWRVVNVRQWLPQYRERLYIVGFRRDLQLEMDWGDLCGVDHVSAGCVVRDILEPNDAAAIAAAELRPEQWETVKSHGVPLTEREIPIDGKAPCLTSGYHKGSNCTTKYVFEERDGTRRDGQGDNPRPRFLTPRECARLMGFPDSFVIPGEDEEQKRGHWYRQIGNAVCPPAVLAV